MLNRGQTSQQLLGLSSSGWAHFHLLAQTQKVSTHHVRQTCAQIQAENVVRNDRKRSYLLKRGQ